jgi:hypothetical protein
LSENKRGRKVKKLDSISSWFSRHWLSAMDRRSKLDFTSYIYYYDGRSWRYDTFITYQEFAHRVTIVFISAGIFGAGVGQLLIEFLTR